MTRLLILIGVLSTASCGGSPASLGITGPGAPPSAPPVQDNLSPAGIPDAPNSFAPSVGPAPSTGRYYNYN